MLRNARPLRRVLRERSGARGLGLALLIVAAPNAAAQQPLTLDEALREARTSNAHLPVAALNTSIARAQLSEARARLGPRLWLDGDVHDGAPREYTTGDARFQAIGADTIFDGGRLRANVRVSEAQFRGAAAGFRIAEKDLTLDVRVRFAEAIRFQEEVAIREAGIARLRAYLTLLEARQASGEGIASDVLRTRSRLAEEEANAADAERQLDQAQLELNNLMGRPPRAPLTLAALPEPASLPTVAGAPWLRTPDVVQAEQGIAAARAGIAVARADRRPQLSITADAGVLPLLPGGELGQGLNTGRGAGTEITLWFSWPVFDAGVFKARLQQAQLAAAQAENSGVAVRRESELAWARAAEDLEDLFRAVRLRAANVPLARDSYLDAESLYRGGRATALEVLDAYAAWVDAQIAHAEAVLNFREAEARYERWGTP